jgi:hypothetical protein
MRLSSLFASGSLIACGTLALVASSGACRGDSGTTQMDAPAAGGTKIQDVQSDMMAPGTPVTLKGVVVTAVDTFGAKTGDLWVEEPEGGAFSGVHVFKADVNVVATLVVGDIIDISGAQKSEFALSGSGGDMTGRTVTELEPVTGGVMVVTKTGSGNVPAPSIVDALAIGQMYDQSMAAAGGGAAFTNAWEQWEGVLITVDNVAATSAPKGFGKVTPYPADAYAFNITGVAKVEGTLTDIANSGISRATCLGTVTGVVDYFYDYLILPRTASDFSTGGTGCPQPESACTDSVDNDGNGFVDCKDDGCIVNTASCRATSTINALDTASALPMGGLELGSTETVCVTAIGRNGNDFWVSKGPGVAAANQGIYIFSGGTPLGTGVAVGTKVDIIGSASLYNNDTTGNKLLEFNELQSTMLSGACTVTPAVGMTAANLSMDANGKPMIGSLVTLTNVKVSALGDSTNHGAGAMVQAGTTFEYQSDILANYLPAAELNKCYATITGIWSYDVYTNKYSLEPLDLGTGTGTCT